MDVNEFPYTPFLGESVKFHFESADNVKPEDFNFPKGSLGVLHLAFASNKKPEGDESKDYSLQSLEYFPSSFYHKNSPLKQLATNNKFSASLGDKLESVGTRDDLEVLVEAVVGCGKKLELLTTDLATVANTLASVLTSNKLKHAALLLLDFTEEYVELLLTQLLFQLCPDNRFKKDNKHEFYLENLFVFNKHAKNLSHMQQRVKAFSESMDMAKQLTSAPPNYCNTVTVSEFFKKKLTSLGLKVKVLEYDDCKKLNMFCYLSVAQGSKFPPKFLHAVYKPEGEVKKRLAFVGKGLMFDSGGYNIKSSSSMIHYMKLDMAGFGTVFSAAYALAKLKPNNVELHFVGGLCENMLDANSYRPGDVVTASNGKTVEVLNTDAEGRVTLADSLYYAAQLNPDYLVDCATLTGAAMVALGVKCAAFYSNDEDLALLYENSARNAGELMWRMPLLKDYKDLLKSNIADYANVNFNGKCGSINGALFLKEFVDDKKWLHVDFAGPVFDFKNEKGTGFGVLTLLNFVLSLT
ncbi:cytosol aminopeptidase domain protein [Theileria parva strain Muguga]|uniref:cytosol aminopeptidase domain protein n=1 Tax=Theileria parva strain Muguga TaxID=333668 RepID=UPI001C61A39E|nr:cytosol aminopeptidase domain protein [Theileria parva strain Muguga]EAN31913.2 cytosol aminopeptidase domain protein [Theileria parva strain Muguga]